MKSAFAVGLVGFLVAAVAWGTPVASNTLFEQQNEITGRNIPTDAGEGIALTSPNTGTFQGTQLQNVSTSVVVTIWAPELPDAGGNPLQAQGNLRIYYCANCAPDGGNLGNNSGGFLGTAPYGGWAHVQTMDMTMASCGSPDGGAGGGGAELLIQEQSTCQFPPINLTNVGPNDRLVAAIDGIGTFWDGGIMNVELQTFQHSLGTPTP